MNITHDHETTAARICQDCAELAVETVTREIGRFAHIGLITFRCPLGHLQFETLAPATPTPVRHAA